MGLDITSYARINVLDCLFDGDGNPIDPITREELEYDSQIYINPDFPKHAEGLADKAVFASEDADGFRAGSYGGYNQWREKLAEFGGYAPVEDERHGVKSMRYDAGAWKAQEGPFAELINFSDCEGVIGPVVSAKLAKDFSDHQERADSFGDEHWRDLYRTWRKAFEMASDNGLVSFH